MAIYVGTNQVSKIYLGTQQLKKVYWGTTVVYQNELTLNGSFSLENYESYDSGAIDATGFSWMDFSTSVNWSWGNGYYNSYYQVTADGGLTLIDIYLLDQQSSYAQTIDLSRYNDRTKSDIHVVAQESQEGDWAGMSGSWSIRLYNKD